jgi:two-component system chemotaxis response regulator CheB
LNKIKVLVIDDSAFNRRVLSDILSSMPDIEVAGVAVDGEDGLRKLISLKPDVVTLDLEMPVMDGFMFIRMSMATAPTPIVVVSSKKEDVNVFKAMDLGAVDFLAKPTDVISPKLFDIKSELIEKIIIASKTKISTIKKRIHKFRELDIHGKKIKDSDKICSASFNFNDTKQIEVVAIGASTGGPSALKNLLSELPVNLDVAVVVSQHMPKGFTASFSRRLNESSEYLIVEAEDGEHLEKGKVLIAPGGYHLMFEQSRNNVHVKLNPSSSHDKNIPSINSMFKSISNIFKSKVLGVVLTGMGSDGKEGVFCIKNFKGKVIAESEETAVVFGMPNEAIKTGIVDKVVPLDDISDTIVSVCSKSKFKK